MEMETNKVLDLQVVQVMAATRNSVFYGLCFVL